MDSQPLPGGSGPVWPAQAGGFGDAQRGWVNGPQLFDPRGRPAADLFQPFTDLPPAQVASTDRAVAPVNGVTKQGGSSVAAEPQSESASRGCRWVGRRDQLVVGPPGAVITVVASAVLVVVLGGMTMAMTSWSRQSPQAELRPDRVPSSAPPAMGDESVTVSSRDTSAGFAGQTPDAMSSPQPAAVPVHRQPGSITRQGRSAAASPGAHHAPLSPPPAPGSPPPPSATTTDDARSWMFPGSFPGNMESPTTDTGPCHCDAVMRTIPGYRDSRSPRAGHPRESRAVQPKEYRSTSATPQPTTSE